MYSTNRPINSSVFVLYSQNVTDGTSLFSGYNSIYFGLFIIPAISIWGNSLVCISVWAEVGLRKRFNYFLVSLAISDLLCAILVMPISAWKMIDESAEQRMNHYWCLVWYSLDVFFTASTIIHLCTISLDRYTALRRPLRLATTRNRPYRSLAVQIACAWTVPFCTAGPLFILATELDQKHHQQAAAVVAMATAAATADVVSKQQNTQQSQPPHSSPQLSPSSSLSSSSPSHPQPQPQQQSQMQQQQQLQRHVVIYRSTPTVSCTSDFCVSIGGHTLPLQSTSAVGINVSANVIIPLHPSSPQQQSFKGCGPQNGYFILIATIVTFFIPLAIMTVTYILTVRVLYLQRKEAEANLYSNAVASLVLKPGFGSMAKMKKNFLTASTNTITTTNNNNDNNDNSSKNNKIDNNNNNNNRQSNSTGSLSKPTTVITNNNNSNQLIQMNELSSKSERVLDQLSSSSTINTNRQAILSVRFCHTVHFAGQEDYCKIHENPISNEISTNNTALTTLVNNSRSLPKLMVRSISCKSKIVTNSSNNNNSSNNRNKDDKSNIDSNHTNLQSCSNPGQPTSKAYNAFCSKRRETERHLRQINRSRKAVQTLGILFLLFVLCYLPFFVVYLVDFFSSTVKGTSSEAMGNLLTLLEWVGYSGSMFNPIVYHFFNPIFRHTYRRLMRCQCHQIRIRHTTSSVK